MIDRFVNAVLHRSGSVRHLRALWRDDDRARATELSERTRKAETAQHALLARMDRADETLQRLSGAVDSLTNTCTALTRQIEGFQQVLISNQRDGTRTVAFGDAITNGRLASHISDAVATASMTTDPAPRLVIDGMFPKDIYKIFLAAIPPAIAFTEKDDTKADYRSRRPNGPTSDLSGVVWSALDEEIIPQMMVPAVAARFAPFIGEYYRALLGERIGTAVAALPLEATDARLMLRRPGYHLEPHLDPKRVLLTWLIYFARPGDSEALGTSFYRVDGRVVRDHASTYYPRAAGHTCELVDVVPFRPNTAVVFLNSAAHGVDLPAAEPDGLERFALQFYIGPPRDALRDMLQQLPHAEREAWAQFLN